MATIGSRLYHRAVSEPRHMKLLFFIARMVPKSIRYIIIVDAIAETTTGPRYGKTEIPEYTAMELMRRIEHWFPSRHRG